MASLYRAPCREAPSLNRRQFLAAGASLSLMSLGALPSAAAAATKITAGPTSVMLDPARGETQILAYGGQVPGPLLRVRQGERLSFELHNALDEATTVHCHGMRMPNPMDGVPFLTQAPIEPGAAFLYDFEAVDAGTFWYHPHLRDDGAAGPEVSMGSSWSRRRSRPRSTASFYSYWTTGA